MGPLSGEYTLLRHLQATFPRLEHCRRPLRPRPPFSRLRRSMSVSLLPSLEQAILTGLRNDWLGHHRPA